MHSSANSNHSSCSSETKFLHIEFSDLHVSEEDSVEAGCDQLKSQFFEAKRCADKDSVLVPTDVSSVVHSSQQKPLGIGELW